MRAVAIALEGVLRKPLDVEATDVGGLMLYASLVENFRVVVLGGYSESADDQFLTMNGMLRHVKIAPLREEDGLSEYARKREQIRRLRAEGFKFEFLVLSDPQLAKEMLDSGFPVLLYAHPQFTESSFSPQGARAWSELSAAVDYSVRAKAERVKREMTTQ